MRFYGAACMVAVATSSTACAAPDIPVVNVRLPEASGRLSHGFSSINSATELKDGRLLVSDPRDRTLYVADFESDTVVLVGARGEGPYHYMSPGRVIGFHPDSTLQVDLLARRWLFLVGSDVVAQSSPDDPMLADGSMIFGADRLGRVARLVSPPLTPGGSTISLSDSISVVLLHRTSLKGDTVVRLRPTPPKPEPYEYQAYYSAEQAYLNPDGWVVVVRLDPYRVEWLSPTGEWTLGEPLPVEHSPVTGAERHFFGRLSGASSLGRDWESRFQWPTDVPPVAFQSEWLFSPDGHVVLLGQRRAADPGIRYERVDRHGDLIAQITVEDDQRIIAIGREHVYVATTDPDGLLFVSRHPWH